MITENITQFQMQSFSSDIHLALQPRQMRNSSGFSYPYRNALSLINIGLN